jgi:predicted phage baseplate assembly protein
MLAVTLRGALAPGRVEISLGFELEQDAAAEEADLLGGLRVSIVRGDSREQPVEIVADTTGGLRRSGAMILAFDGGPQRQLRELRFRAARDTLMPHLLRIAVNAVPVEQRATIRSDEFRGSGRPGQSVSLDPRFAFPPDEPPGERPWRLIDAPDALTVLVEEAGRLVRWSVGRLDEAAAGDACYEWSERSGGGEIEIRFGNGVNGRRPAEGAQIRIEAKLSAGAAGNVASSLIWRMDGLGLSWRNPEPIAGGADPDDTSDLLERLRARLRDQRTLAASADIEAAARRLSRAYGIARAEIVEGWEPGRRRPASPATRTLLVTREGEANETDHWLRAISAALRPRIAIAERLVVAAPVRRRLGLRIRAIAERGRVPAEVERSIRDLLLRRLGPGAAWPLGRHVTATAVGGWVRGLAGVARVTEAALLDGNGRALGSGRLPLGTGELPSLAAQDIDVRVEPGASR